MFKRNQLEEAIARLVGANSPKLRASLRTRLKRLLDLDRSLGRDRRSHNTERSNYAFYSEDAPGKGIEIWFSEYEAFALSLALRLLHHGWPQGFAVETLRRLRPALEVQHIRFLRQDPEKLFDTTAMQKSARAGDLAFDNTDPVLLTIVSRTKAMEASADATAVCGVCRGMQELANFLKQHDASSWSLHELVTPGHALSKYLKQVPPERRGRP
jgi:hypothetical protein